MASYSSSTLSRSNSVSSSSRSSPPGHASTSHTRPGSSDHQTLLTPVVRSKRTPIACTECRRRQVKCTGTTPRCERCEKKGVKCEYIPCSQQKATTAASPALSPAQLATYPNPSSNGSHHVGQYPQSHYQHPSRSNQVYVAESSMPYQQHPNWQPHTSASIIQPSHYYGNAEYSQSTYPPHNSSAMSAMTRQSVTYAPPDVVPSQAYIGAGYNQGIANQSLSYPYNLVGEGSAHALANHSSTNYPEYYHSSASVFDTRATGMVSEQTDKSWAESIVCAIL
ncbi:hypothetical protein BXZ70DRAFT_412851 [Cristinia sonorae]|uniref:Zn(2)-C6 fungal-type domain-containing protein n=1 Tax=Cristinia sonorae TaxID=1940300 RepID=A0A8K0UW39_9AGAR|nr:hypothetical protein BXZ70DRAFT_412851 [Cristinia sonorae]